ncbi:MAG: DUF6261 family protein [Bacteroidales bacterium]|nr:hypothetical protein [Bacteroidales bacterium]MBS3775976.1 hypothetical protein [Bacteroidales bacterium]
MIKIPDFSTFRNGEFVKFAGFYYKKLVESNYRFNKLYLERNKEYACAPREKMSHLRATSKEALKKLINMINAAVVFYDKKYQPLINELNSLVESYQTRQEIAQKYQIHPNQVQKWKREFLNNAEQVFEKDSTKKKTAAEKGQQELYKKIGQLQVEVDFLKNALS